MTWNRSLERENKFGYTLVCVETRISWNVYQAKHFMGKLQMAFTFTLLSKCVPSVTSRER